MTFPAVVPFAPARKCNVRFAMTNDVAQKRTSTPPTMSHHNHSDAHRERPNEDSLDVIRVSVDSNCNGETSEGSQATCAA